MFPIWEQECSDIRRPNNRRRRNALTNLWIDPAKPGRLAIMARPRSGDWLEEEISGWAEERIDVVVSLLEREEIADLGLREEEALCRGRGMEFVSFPIPDRNVPASSREMLALAGAMATRIDEGKAVAVHCQAGIGRASLVAACILVRLRFDPLLALDAIGKARGVVVPDTDAQREWIVAFGEVIRSACPQPSRPSPSSPDSA